MALFHLGRLVATRAALKFCGDNRIDALTLLARHVHGDFGDISIHDKKANTAAIKDGSRIFSAYRFPSGIVWIITEAVGDDGTRASTCVLMPKDY